MQIRAGNNESQMIYKNTQVQEKAAVGGAAERQSSRGRMLFLQGICHCIRILLPSAGRRRRDRP